jgi:tetratricopeptide (TPR) repeat protein
MRKSVLVLGLVAFAAVSVISFMNIDLYYRSKKEGLTSERNLSRLRWANRLLPISDQTLAEEGKACLELALENLADVELAGRSLRRAESLFRRALRFNPASCPNHFYYAKTLQYLSFLPGAEVPDSLPELWKAARLSGDRSSLTFDIVLMMLDRWPSLSPEQHRFVLQSLKKILAEGHESQFQSLLHSWFLNVKDATLLNDILPESSKLYRTYARFLGEMSLSLEARQKMLALAEDLDYNQAVREYDAGRPEACLRLLDGIRFYSALVEKKDITPQLIRHQLLVKSALLSRAKGRLMKNRKLEEAEDDLRAYLKLETDYNEVLALETYLQELSLIQKEQAVRLVQGNIRNLAFELYLMYCAHKYTQITGLGAALGSGLVVTNPSQNKYLREILMLIADSYNKLNFLYEPERFYQQALEAAPNDWEVLLKLRLYYERMNEAAKMARVNQALSRVLTPQAVVLTDGLIGKERSRVLSLVLDSTSGALTLLFRPPEGQNRPLVTVLLNGRVIWEEYLAASDLTLNVEVKPGINLVEIKPINRPVEFAGFKFLKNVIDNGLISGR